MSVPTRFMILTLFSPSLTGCGLQQISFTLADSLAIADTLRRVVVESAARLSTLNPTACSRLSAANPR